MSATILPNKENDAAKRRRALLNYLGIALAAGGVGAGAMYAATRQPAAKATTDKFSIPNLENFKLQPIPLGPVFNEGRWQDRLQSIPLHDPTKPTAIVPL